MPTLTDINRSGLDIPYAHDPIPWNLKTEGGPHQVYVLGGVKNSDFHEMQESLVKKRRLEVRARNSRTAIDNGLLWGHSCNITPLLDPATGDNMENCPTTFSDIRGLSSDEATRILNILQLRVPETLDEKRDRVMRKFGGRVERLMEWPSRDPDTVFKLWEYPPVDPPSKDPLSSDPPTPGTSDDEWEDVSGWRRSKRAKPDDTTDKSNATSDDHPQPA